MPSTLPSVSPSPRSSTSSVKLIYTSFSISLAEIKVCICYPLAEMQCFYSLTLARIVIFWCDEVNLTNSWLLIFCRSVRKVYCGKTADWIRMPFGMVCGIGQGMGILDWVGNRRRKGAVLEDEFGTSHCNQWGLCCIVVRETRSSQITCYNTDCSEA